MESNRKSVMFLILIAIAFIKLAVGNLSERYRCLHHMKYFCGGMNKPSIDDCGKWAVLRYRHGISDVPNYIHYYLEQNILRGITAPGMKTTNKFCSDRVEKQLESNNYRNRMFHHMDFLAKASDYDEGSSSSEAGTNLELDDGETKLKFMKFRLIFQCLDNLAKYTETVRNDIIEFPLYYINELSENTATYRRYIIEYALLCVNLDTFENPNTYDYENNEAAKDYLIHISDMVKVSNRQAQDPVKYCIYIDRPKSNFLPNEMFPFK